MRYPYYNPNLPLPVVIKAIFKSGKKSRVLILKYFRELTGKQYILITNSCRTALYLAYRSLNKTGEVITSPLTCKSAIDPIEESNNKPVYADINIGNLNIDTQDIEHRITKATTAIQAIHLGGNACNMDELMFISRKYGLTVIEDCAQAFGALYNGINAGSFGDIACFSLIKNAYGIGGGIFATQSKELFQAAVKLNRELRRQSNSLIIYRLIRNILDTSNEYFVSQKTLKLLNKIKGGKRSIKSFQVQIKKISSLQIKIVATQLKRINNLHRERKRVGLTFYKIFSKKGIMTNLDFDPHGSSFTKFYIYSQSINYKQLSPALINMGIEVKHLEQKATGALQPRIISDIDKKINTLPNYNMVHDHLISIPICEDFSDKDINYIASRVIDGL